MYLVISVWIISRRSFKSKNYEFKNIYSPQRLVRFVLPNRQLSLFCIMEHYIVCIFVLALFCGHWRYTLIALFCGIQVSKRSLEIHFTSTILWYIGVQKIIGDTLYQHYFVVYRYPKDHWRYTLLAVFCGIQVSKRSLEIHFTSTILWYIGIEKIIGDTLY